MAKLILRRFFMILLGIGAVASVAAAQTDPDTTPKITSVSKITTAKDQTITITGTGFGTHASYTGDTNYISFYDETKKWEAGYKPDNDTVTLIVNSWTNTKITVGGFAGAWGTNGWTLTVGNKEEIRLWNAQGSGGPFGLSCNDGCVSKTVTVSKTDTAIELTSWPNPSALGEPVTFTAVVSSAAGAPRDGETVSFMKGTTVLGTGTLHGGSASFMTSILEPGDHAINAVYGGDSNFAGSISSDGDSGELIHRVN
jgi:Bacterial Ig-like domain (group 3)/IPT/TIG domain